MSEIGQAGIALVMTLGVLREKHTLSHILGVQMAPLFALGSLIPHAPDPWSQKLDYLLHQIICA